MMIQNPPFVLLMVESVLGLIPTNAHSLRAVQLQCIMSLGACPMHDGLASVRTEIVLGMLQTDARRLSSVQLIHHCLAEAPFTAAGVQPSAHSACVAQAQWSVFDFCTEIDWDYSGQ